MGLPILFELLGHDLGFKSLPMSPSRTSLRPMSPGVGRLWCTIAIYINHRPRAYGVETTTVQLSKEMKKTLQAMKLHPRETYEEVLERLLEDLRELNEETKREIEKAIREIRAGKYHTHAQLKEEMGF